MYVYPRFQEKWSEMGPMLHKQGKLFWVNGPMSGTLNPPYVHRIIYGFESWRSDIDGLTPWNYDRVTGHPMSGFEGGSNNDYYFALEGPDGQVPTIHHELARVGVYDRRAVYALEQLIAANLDSANRDRAGKAKEARQFLEQLRGDMPRVYVMYPDPPLDATARSWLKHEVDRYRNGLMDRIIELQ